MTGTVKWFDEAKGYGFVTGDNGVEHFVHKTDARDDLPLVTGEQVAFDVRFDDRKRTKAVNVRRFQEQPEG